MKNRIVFLLIFAGILSSCNSTYDPVYRERMRGFVESISSYAKQEHPDFIIIPQNGHELVTLDGEGNSEIQYDYLSAIDGAGQEDLYYGYASDNKATNPEDTEYLLAFLDLCEQNGIEVLVTDYCSSEDKMDDSYLKNNEKDFISFAAPERELDVIPSYPEIYNKNNNEINSLSDARNFLYLINPDLYSSKNDFISAVSATDYDLLIIDFFHKESELTKDDLDQLKVKNSGGRRLVISYMSIGEAEDYRYYWKNEWNDDPPEWLDKENPRWKGNYKVEYWNPDWQSIIFGSTDSYLDKIINAGFDGVYLDIIEAFEYFE